MLSNSCLCERTLRSFLGMSLPNEIVRGISNF
jgi:hypothetical protein